MSAFEKPKQYPASHELAGRLNPAGDESRNRPRSKRRRVQPAQRPTVSEPSKGKRTKRESPTEKQLKVTILFLVEMELCRDSNGCIGKRLAIHVIDRRGHQEQSANDPLP